VCVSAAQCGHAPKHWPLAVHGLRHEVGAGVPTAHWPLSQNPHTPVHVPPAGPPAQQALPHFSSFRTHRSKSGAHQPHAPWHMLPDSWQRIPHVPLLGAGVAGRRHVLVALSHWLQSLAGSQRPDEHGAPQLLVWLATHLPRRHSVQPTVRWHS
jgi:hypothetical protein